MLSNTDGKWDKRNNKYKKRSGAIKLNNSYLSGRANLTLLLKSIKNGTGLDINF